MGMPIGDLIVICFSSPVFSLILESLILKRPMTVLSVFLCISIVGGDILAVQPPFIFSSINSPSHSNNSNSSMTEGDTDTLESEREGSGYILGVILCLAAAVAAAIINIVQISLKNNFADITK